jgi:hypothetical protein
MAISPAVLLVELIMSADRMVQSAQMARTIEGHWSPPVVLGHVTQVDEQVWLPRITQMIDCQEYGMSAPSFGWWEPDPEATRATYAGHSLEQASAELMACRTKFVTYLRGMTQGQWTATGVHDTFGELDIASLLIEVLRHDEEHRASLV